MKATNTSEQPTHVFTLTFKRGQIAILKVQGTTDQEQARAAAASAFKGVEYDIEEGDRTGGKAEAFYIQPQEEGRKRFSELSQEELDALLEEAHGAVAFLTTLDITALSEQERAEYPQALQEWFRVRNLLQAESVRRILADLAQQLDTLRAKVKAAKAQSQEGGAQQ